MGLGEGVVPVGETLLEDEDEPERVADEEEQYYDEEDAGLLLLLGLQGQVGGNGGYGVGSSCRCGGLSSSC